MPFGPKSQELYLVLGSNLSCHDAGCNWASSVNVRCMHHFVRLARVARQRLCQVPWPLAFSPSKPQPENLELKYNFISLVVHIFIRMPDTAFLYHMCWSAAITLSWPPGVAIKMNQDTLNSFPSAKYPSHSTASLFSKKKKLNCVQ